MANARNEESIASRIAARRGIYYPAFSIYNELGGFYDYGPIGVRIKRNIEGIWRKIFVGRLEAMEIETTSIMTEQVFKASGHLSAFTDPVATCTICHTPYRLDKLLEEYYTEKGDTKSAAEVKKMSIKELAEKVREHGIRCSKCGGELSNVEKFNLMFKTNIGVAAGEPAYLRPETAQGIFVDFRPLSKTHSFKLPAAIAQVGKSYRNEISPRQKLVRMREFTQMEVEVFFDPEASTFKVEGIDINEIMKSKIPFLKRGAEKAEEEEIGKLLSSGNIPNEILALLLHLEDLFMRELGFSKGSYRFRELEKEELPHYSKGNVDLEVETSYGYIETAGNAYRTDFDLRSHGELSGSDISVVSNGRKVIPHVVEASIGLDRTFFALLDNVGEEGKDRGWQWLRLSERVAPYKYAIFPLQKDEKLIEKARGIYNFLREKNIACYYAESGSIGKRYAKADEIGVPYSITIDYQTLEDDTFTVRDRDTTKQTRRIIDDLQ